MASLSFFRLLWPAFLALALKRVISQDHDQAAVVLRVMGGYRWVAEIMGAKRPIISAARLIEFLSSRLVTTT